MTFLLYRLGDWCVLRLVRARVLELVAQLCNAANVFLASGLCT